MNVFGTQCSNLGKLPFRSSGTVIGGIIDTKRITRLTDNSAISVTDLLETSVVFNL